MAEGISTSAANSALDTLLDGTASYIQLHVGAPGASGTANVATETTRKVVTFAAAASGSKASNSQAQWTNVAGSEDYTHFSVWTAAAAGTFKASGSVTANPVTAGDTFTVASGGLTVSLTVAS